MYRLDDMRVLAAVAETGSFSHAARRLGLPKQSVSRRMAELEADLGVRLCERTTRVVTLTAAGAELSARCSELVRLADEAVEAAQGASECVRGTLRVTADPLLGEMVLPELLNVFLQTYPDVSVEVLLTDRHVDLIAERVDVAFRVGSLDDSALIATRVAPAELCYCASPGYLKRRGVPCSSEELARHDCIVLAPEGTPGRWAFAAAEGVRWQRVEGRLRVNSLKLARSAAVSGLGIVNLPRFACERELQDGELALVLEDECAPFGSIYLVHASRKFLPLSVQRFRELAIEALRGRPELSEPSRSAGAR